MTHPVKHAVSLFKQGRYQEARRYYQSAAERYGAKLFSANIALCDKYLLNKPNTPLLSANQVTKPSYNESDAAALAKQLANTQARLEYYYTRCQELQYQIMDAK